MIQLPPIPLRTGRTPGGRRAMSPEVDDIIGAPTCPVFSLTRDDGHLEDEFSASGTTYSSSAVEPAAPVTETETRGSSTSAAYGILSGQLSEVFARTSPMVVGANLRDLGKRASTDNCQQNPVLTRCKRKRRGKETKRVNMADPTTTRPRKRRNMLRTLDGPDIPSGEALATVLKENTSAQHVSDRQKELDRLRTKRDVLMQELGRVKATNATLQGEALRKDGDANEACFDATEAELYLEVCAASRKRMIEDTMRAVEEAEEKAQAAASAARLSNMDVRRVYRMAMNAEEAWKRASTDTSDLEGKAHRPRGREFQPMGIASQGMESTVEKDIVVTVWDSEEEKPTGMESVESRGDEYSGGVNSNEAADVSVPTASTMAVDEQDCPDQSHDDDDADDDDDDDDDDDGDDDGDDDESTDEGQGGHLSWPLQLFRPARTDGETKPASISWRAFGFDRL